MAPNPKNNVHNDAWMTDNYAQLSGPLGRSPDQFSTTIGRDCITLTFDSKGRLVGTCTDLAHGPALYLFDPQTLDTLAFLQLPFVAPPAGTNPATNTTGGAYFYLDNQDRAVVATADRQINVYAETDANGQPGFQPVAVLRPDAVPAAGRAHALGPARQPGPAVVHRPHPRHRRRARPEHGQVQRDRPRRGDRELVRGRQGWRLHRQRHRPVQAPRRCRPQAPDRLARDLPQRRPAEGGPVQRRVGNDADALMGQQAQHQEQCPRVRVDHRQRRPARRRRLPGGGQAQARPEARRLPGADLQARVPARTRTRSSRWDGA